VKIIQPLRSSLPGPFSQAPDASVKRVGSGHIPSSGPKMSFVPFAQGNRGSIVSRQSELLSEFSGLTKESFVSNFGTASGALNYDQMLEFFQVRKTSSDPCKKVALVDTELEAMLLEKPEEEKKSEVERMRSGSLPSPSKKQGNVSQGTGDEN